MLAAPILAVPVLAGAARAECVDPLAGEARPRSADFVQTRRLAGVAVPLVSRGTSELAEGRIEWRVTDPVPVTTIITRSGVAQSIEGGPPEPLGPQAAGGIVSGAGLFDLLTGDFAAVRGHYDIEVRESGEAGWALGLRPRAPGLAAAVSEIVVRGCTAIESVEIHQAGGDVLEVAFAADAP